MGVHLPPAQQENHQVCGEILKRGESDPDNEGRRHLDRGKNDPAKVIEHKRRADAITTSFYSQRLGLSG